MERALCPVLVGRQDELALLEDALRDSISGHGRMVLLAGEPGSGKSRLGLELGTVADGLGVTVLVGACPETDLALPYLPFVEAIGAHLVGVDKNWVKELGDARDELAKLFPQIPTGGRPDLDDPVRAKLRLFEAIGAVLDAIAATAGLLLILEDVHWADASSRELLEYLIGRLPRSRIMILATYRSDEVNRRHPLHSQVQAWSRNGRAEIITLKPLGAAAVADIVKAIFDTREVPTRLRDALLRRSEGNPFVLEEVLKEALDEGTITFDGHQLTGKDIDQVALPRTVADAILRRLDRVEPSDAAILRTASVLGRSFGYTTLMEVADVPEGDLQRALEVGIQQQLLEDDEHSTGQRYRFRHALTREAIYGEMVLPQRKTLHARAAAALRRHRGTAAVDIAFHLLAAGAGPETVPTCLEAAEDAIRRRGYSEAAELYRRVLPHISDDYEHGLVVCRLGDAMWKSGDPATAQEHLEEGTATLERLGRDAETAHFLMTLARCHWERSRLDLAHGDYERARDLLLPLGSSEDLAVAYCGLASLYAVELDGPNAQRLAELAISVAGEVGATMPLIRAYNFLGVALVFQGRIDEGLEFMDRSHREALEKDLDWNALTALYNSIIIRLWHLRAAECRVLVEQLHQFPAGWWRDLAYWRARALTYHMLGELDTALAACDEVLQLAEQGGASTFSVWARRHRAYLLAELGRAHEGLDALPERQEGEDRQDLFFDYRARMRVHLSLDQADAAVELAGFVLAADDWAQDALVVAAAAEAFVAGGRSDLAQELLDRAVTNGLDPDSPYLLASAARVDVARGDFVAAMPRLTEAAGVFEEREYRIDEIRVRLLMAETLEGLGEHGPAQAELDRALALADRCGATTLRTFGRGLARDLHLHLGIKARAAKNPAAANTMDRSLPGLGAELRLALHQDQLRLYYQPKLNLRTGQVDAAEGLVRWQHPRFGLMFPDRFIPVAEKVGVIGGVTHWVLAAGLEQVRDWRERGLAVAVSVNASASDISDPNFAQVVQAALERADVEAGLLCLEITESQIMSRPKRALETLNALKMMGVGLSIDDFGTGQSSLAYVGGLPVSELKIDRSFCMDLDDRNLVVVGAAIELGHKLGMTVTAEGVENRGVLETLTALGCDHAQGNVLGPPALAPVLTRRLVRDSRKLAART